MTREAGAKRVRQPEAPAMAQWVRCGVGCMVHCCFAVCRMEPRRRMDA